MYACKNGAVFKLAIYLHYLSQIITSATSARPNPFSTTLGNCFLEPNHHLARDSASYSSSLYPSHSCLILAAVLGAFPGPSLLMPENSHRP